MKSKKRNSRDKQNPSTQQVRTSALRALSGNALKAVKGGTGTNPPPPSSDPIC